MLYDPRMIAPMRAELTSAGVRELLNAADVYAFMAEASGTALLVINSVCGCAAGSARPGVRRALEHPLRPVRVATVFAGQDPEATARARSYFPELAPSSPSFILLKDGKPVRYVSRQMIEGQDPESVRAILAAAFEELTAAVR